MLVEKKWAVLANLYKWGEDRKGLDSPMGGGLDSYFNAFFTMCNNFAKIGFRS